MIVIMASLAAESTGNPEIGHALKAFIGRRSAPIRDILQAAVVRGGLNRAKRTRSAA